MAYPIQLNNQYKSEKEAGLTTAKSFPEWNKQRLANELNALEAHLEQDVQTSEEVEAAILNTTLTTEQVDAVVATLNPIKPLVLNTTVELELHKLVLNPVETSEPVVHTSKAAHARAIYDEIMNHATAQKLEVKRATIINRFVTELPISKVGAATYLQNIKLKKGLVNHK